MHHDLIICELKGIGHIKVSERVVYLFPKGIIKSPVLKTAQSHEKEAQ